jgi:hypothetical protein
MKSNGSILLTIRRICRWNGDYLSPSASVEPPQFFTDEKKEKIWQPVSGKNSVETVPCAGLPNSLLRQKFLCGLAQESSC